MGPIERASKNEWTTHLLDRPTKSRRDRLPAHFTARQRPTKHASWPANVAPQPGGRNQITDRPPPRFY